MFSIENKCKKFVPISVKIEATISSTLDDITTTHRIESHITDLTGEITSIGFSRSGQLEDIRLYLLLEDKGYRYKYWFPKEHDSDQVYSIVIQDGERNPVVRFEGGKPDVITMANRYNPCVCCCCGIFSLLQCDTQDYFCCDDCTNCCTDNCTIS